MSRHVISIIGGKLTVYNRSMHSEHSTFGNSQLHMTIIQEHKELVFLNGRKDVFEYPEQKVCAYSKYG